MTDDDIMKMARKAGLYTHKDVQPEILSFANLVAAAKAEVALAEAYRCGVEAGAAVEREAIAKLADSSVNADKYPTLTMLAQAIRMRGDADKYPTLTMLAQAIRMRGD